MKKVLIIEDDKGIAELERDYLEANGFEVQMAFTGLSGKKAALSSPVDLILCLPRNPSRKRYPYPDGLRKTGRYR